VPESDLFLQPAAQIVDAHTQADIGDEIMDAGQERFYRGFSPNTKK